MCIKVYAKVFIEVSIKLIILNVVYVQLIQNLVQNYIIHQLMIIDQIILMFIKLKVMRQILMDYFKWYVKLLLRYNKLLSTDHIVRINRYILLFIINIFNWSKKILIISNKWIFILYVLVLEVFKV